MSAMFRSLSRVNYRLWFAGALVSNVGTWMQRTAQDWIVLTELTDHDATAVGVTMALQFGPMLLLLPVTGFIADRFVRRHTLLVTQIAMGSLGVLLGVMTLLGLANIWVVWGFALALGVVSAIDAPARQTFVSELVSDDDLPNAVALNSASFNVARLIGPAAAGLITAAVGAGWAFLANGLTFAAMVAALLLLRPDQLRPAKRSTRGRGQLLGGFKYVGTRPDILVVLTMVFLVGTFGFNFPIYTSTMASVVFDAGAAEFGWLSSILAIGSVTGALLAARRDQPRLRLVVFSGAGFGFSLVAAAFMPTYWTFALLLVAVGVTSLTMLTSANAYVQTTTSAVVRGRVMALYMAILAGGTPIGAPIVGWVADTFGPRESMLVGGASGLVAALVGAVFLLRRSEVTLSSVAHAPARLAFGRFSRRARLDRETATQEIAVQEASER